MRQLRLSIVVQLLLVAILCAFVWALTVDRPPYEVVPKCTAAVTDRYPNAVIEIDYYPRRRPVEIERDPMDSAWEMALSSRTGYQATCLVRYHGSTGTFTVHLTEAASES